MFETVTLGGCLTINGRGFGWFPGYVLSRLCMPVQVLRVWFLGAPSSLQFHSPDFYCLGGSILRGQFLLKLKNEGRDYWVETTQGT
jgi:hypothetical protein